MGTRYGMRCRKCNVSEEPSTYLIDAEIEADTHRRVTGHAGVIWIARNGKWSQRYTKYTTVYKEE